ncbi:hypothetical protein [Burkholderia sp. lig30]|jgi:hypothetical protein|uniref:hypothetical protein n=1 Tax=Burkholderia sp. lig30 TaxID=1192124 RepID=UPI000A5B209A|nr:hypothetical protein [Burkholderia sp. lig30]
MNDMKIASIARRAVLAGQFPLHDMYVHAINYGVPMMKGDEILFRADFKAGYIAQGVIDEERNRLYRKGGMQ